MPSVSCYEHFSFQYDCPKCQCERVKAYYQEIKDQRKYCNLCQKSVVAICYDRHKKSQKHQLLKFRERFQDRESCHAKTKTDSNE